MALLKFISAMMGCGISDSSLFFNYGYNVKNGQVYYKQPFPEPVLQVNADAASFKVISRVEDTSYADNGYFAIDKQSVYYKGYLLAGSDGPSFQLLHINYAKDKNQVYYKGTVIQNADPATFSVKNDDFSADKGHVFRHAESIDNDTTVFEIFNESHIVHTANNVSIYDKNVTVPRGAVFKYLAFNYFAIDSQLYFWDEPMPDGDINSFLATDDNFFSKTNKHVYYKSKIIEHADPETFKLIVAPYNRDDKYVFFFDRIIMGADVKTFEVINENFQCARDKNAVYHEDKKITKFTQADLANKNHCNNCNENAIYFADSVHN